MICHCKYPNTANNFIIIWFPLSMDLTMVRGMSPPFEGCHYGKSPTTTNETINTLLLVGQQPPHTDTTC